LDGQPAVRHRHELRAGRFEVGPAFDFALNRSFRQAVLFGIKLEYHLNDYLSFGANFAFGVNFDTGLTSELQDSKDPPVLPSGQCPGAPYGCNTPANFGDYRNRFSDLQFVGDIRATITPMAGKISIFSKAFLAYDFYVFAGFGFGMTKNKTDEPDIDAVNEGFRPGFAWGVGMHLFFTKWMAMGLEVKDLVFADNETGGDFTRGVSSEELAQGRKLWNGDDRNITNHFFFTLNFTFYIPFGIEIGR
jgi:outer membrane beta-barrel protein